MDSSASAIISSSYSFVRVVDKKASECKMYILICTVIKLWLTQGFHLWIHYFIPRIILCSTFFKIVVQLQLSPFHPHYSSLPYPTPTSHIQSSPPLTLSMGPLYMFLDLILLLPPMTPLRPPFWSLSVCSIFPCLWFYFAHLFVCWLCSPYRWDHMVFVFHCLTDFTYFF